MAITIQQAPEIIQPVYNPLKHVITSNNYLQPNFKYVCDLYVNGASTYTRVTVPPDPIYGSGVFDPARILEDYVTSDFDSGNVASFTCPNSLISYIVKYGEEYGASSSGTTVYADMTIQSKKYVWNSVFDYEDYCNTSFTDYLSGSVTRDFLTNSPNEKTVYIDSNYSSGNEFIYGINQTSGSIYYMTVGTVDSNLNTVGNYKIINNAQALTTDSQKMVGFPCGYNLNSVSAGDITTVLGTLPIIGTSVYQYIIQFTKFDGTVTSETKTYTIDRTCSKYPLYEVYFLNKLGGYDTFDFFMKSNWKSDIKRESYKKNLGELTSASAFSYNRNQRAVKDYSTTIEDTLTLRSDFVNEATQNWLEELVTSPDVYVLRDGEHIPVNIVSSQFERKQSINEKLFTLTIDVKFSYKRFRQRG